MYWSDAARTSWTCGGQKVRPDVHSRIDGDIETSLPQHTNDLRISFTTDPVTRYFFIRCPRQIADNYFIDESAAVEQITGMWLSENANL